MLDSRAHRYPQQQEALDRARGRAPKRPMLPLGTNESNPNSMSWVVISLSWLPV
jgi:hypothetical protein